MPLNKKGKKIKKAMTKQYGKKKGEKVFYAMENSGKLKKVTKAKGGADMGAPERASERAERGYGGVGKSTGGRQPQAQYQGAKPSEKARQAMDEQRAQARAQISPSTTPAGKAIAATIGAVTGIPYFGYKFGQRMVDYSPMAFGVPKTSRKPKTITDQDRGDGETRIVKQPTIPGPVAINQPILPLAQRRVTSVSPTGRFNYALKKGGMLIKGKPKLTKKGWK